MNRLGIPYHSAYEPDADLDPIDRFESELIIAIRRDAREPLAPEFSGCDLLYSEPPWKAGFEKFNKRAGVHGGKFRDLLLTLAGNLYSSSKPSIMVVSPTVLKDMPPHTIVPVRINGEADACAVFMHMDCKPYDACKTQIDLLCALSKNYGKIGDPTCGYGIAGRVFLLEGKSSVLSDYNGKCIAYIRDNYEEWIKNKNLSI